VVHLPQHLSLHSRIECARADRRLRFFKVLTTTAIVGLGLGGPALASDGEPSMPPTTVLPDAVAPPSPASGSPTDAIPVPVADPPLLPTIDETGAENVVPQEAPEVVTATQAEAGSINVSVRILSPGTDEPVTQDSSGTDVVSPSAEPDITAATNPAAVASSVPSQPAGVNTNVEIRVLSPGDNDAVTQTSESPGVTPIDETEGMPPNEAESSFEAEPPSSDNGDQASVADTDSQRYQGENSQYQSEVRSPLDPWNWSWEFAIDCAGNTTALSSETGSKASLVWTWDWAWNWACIRTDAGATSSSGSGSDSSSISDAGNTNVSVRVLSPGDNGPVTQSTTAVGEAAGDLETTGAAPSTGPWSWIWTFMFCGKTTTFSTQTESQTPLSWTWDWTWSWTCDAAVGAPPVLGATEPGADATPVSAPSTLIPAVQAPVAPPTVAAAVDVPPLPPLPAPPVVSSVHVAIVVVVPPNILAPALQNLSLSPPAVPAVDVHVVIAPAESSRLVASRAAPTTDAADTAPTVSRDAGSITPTTPAAVAWEPRERPRNQPSSQPTAKRASAHVASSRPARTLLPPFGQLRSSQSTDSGTLGGRVPGAPVVAVAALIAFFMLAAPSLGRRIRVARELSPRSTYRSSIDHPG
jgi:hypothetical protein